MWRGGTGVRRGGTKGKTARDDSFSNYFMWQARARVRARASVWIVKALGDALPAEVPARAFDTIIRRCDLRNAAMDNNNKRQPAELTRGLGADRTHRCLAELRAVRLARRGRNYLRLHNQKSRRISLRPGAV